MPIKSNAARLFSDDRISLITMRATNNRTVADLWLPYERRIPRPEFDENAAAVLTRFRTDMLALLEAKFRAPLDPVEISQSYKNAFADFQRLTDHVAAYNSEIRVGNSAIEVLKESTRTARPEDVEQDLARLRRIKTRYEHHVADVCRQLVTLNAEKDALEQQKQQARDTLDQYGSAVLNRYQDAINANLRRFNAGFKIDRVRIEYSGRVPNSTFCIVINSTPVDVGNVQTPIGEPSFRNTLSAGDRSTLALALFLAELAEDPDKQGCVVIFDDPFNSQDQFRRTCTIKEIQRCGEAVAQVVVLSHDRRFLKDLWDLPLPSGERKALWLIPSGGSDSIIAEWPIDTDTESEDAANRRVLLDFYQKNRGSPRDIIQKLRPMLETHMRRIAPDQLNDINGLGNMLERLRTDGGPQPLISAYHDIDDVNTYTRRYMHGENPHAASEVVSPGELHGFVAKVIEITGTMPV